MKNVAIVIYLNNRELKEYVSDIVPLVGDCVDVYGKIHLVTDRIFITNKNKVKLIVENEML